MSKIRQKASKKSKKNEFESRLNILVEEFNQAQEVLNSLVEGSAEFLAQKKICDKLFSNTERFLNRN